MLVSKGKSIRTSFFRCLCSIGLRCREEHGPPWEVSTEELALSWRLTVLVLRKRLGNLWRSCSSGSYRKYGGDHTFRFYKLKVFGSFRKSVEFWHSSPWNCNISLHMD